MRAIVFMMGLLLAVCAIAGPPAANDAAATSSASSTATSSSSSIGSDLEHPDRTCKVDTDCEVKNVGNCCGVHRECVNKDAPTDPAKVKAMCGQEHRMGMCNTRAIGGCSCSKGQCQELNPAAVSKFP